MIAVASQSGTWAKELTRSMIAHALVRSLVRARNNLVSDRNRGEFGISGVEGFQQIAVNNQLLKG